MLIFIIRERREIFYKKVFFNFYVHFDKVVVNKKAPFPPPPSPLKEGGDGWQAGLVWSGLVWSGLVWSGLRESTRLDSTRLASRRVVSRRRRWEALLAFHYYNTQYLCPGDRPTLSAA
jgi:hypothetical protein